MTAVLLIHGFPFDHLQWRRQVSALSRWQCLAPDLLGAGASPGPDSPDEYSMARYASELIRLLDESRIDRAVVCGLSMGGYIAFELLRQIPERVRALILCNTKAAADTPDAKRGRDLLAGRAREQGVGAVAAELMPKLLAHGTREGQPDVVGEVMAMIERQPVPGVVGALRALRERPDSTPLLPRIRVPVLVVAGEEDQITPAAGMQEMARAIGGARFALIAGAGHLPPLEQPVAVNRVFDDFLGQLG
jgi:pimeloyl-ACP methyl ester carboxylesterase